MRSEMMRSVYERFCVLEKHRQPDWDGGGVTTWVDGQEFEAAICLDKANLSPVAQSQSTEAVYRLYIDKGMNLAFPDAIRRIRDGETFQITTNSDDVSTPSISGLNLRMVKARKWVLPA